MHGTDKSVSIANISNEIAQVYLVEAGRPHFMLLELIATEHNDLLRALFLHEDFDEFPAEGACAACHQYDLITPVHDGLRL
jgi:hypothetical protein